MTWIAVAIGGGALIGGVASIAGANKQAGAAKDASNLQMQQFNTLNRQQQPFIQSGYGAQSKINTLLGINPRPGGGGGYGGGYGQPRMQIPQNPYSGSPQVQMGGSGKLQQLLMLRAMHGDTQAQKMLQQMPPQPSAPGFQNGQVPRMVM